MRLHDPLKQLASHHAVDLFHHPHEADGVVGFVGRFLSPPSLLTDPDEPDGVADTLYRLSCRMRRTM